MKNKVNHGSGGTFVAIYGSYLAICDGSVEAATVLRLLELRTKAGEEAVAWTMNGLIEYSKGILTDYSTRAAINMLTKSGLITVNVYKGRKTEYVFNLSSINQAIAKKLGESSVEINDTEASEEQEVPLKSTELGEEFRRNQQNSSVEINDSTVEINDRYRWNQQNFLPENSLEDTENKGTYEEISECPKNNKNVVRMSVRENQEENTYNGSVTTTPLTAVATAPLTSVAYAPSLAINKENFQESAIETTSAIITTSASHPGHEVGKMNTTDVLTEIFIKYAKIPEKKRDAKCKGSASRLMQNWGDRIKPVVDEVGEEALVAMDNFIRDEYWLAKGLPLPAFKSQFRKYLSSEEPESEEQSEIQTSAKPARKSQANSGSSYQPSQFAYTDYHPIAVFSLQDQSGATLRKREALDILQQVGGDLEAEGRAAIGFKIDPSMYTAVEEWHSKALQAYKSIKHRDYPVLTEPIKGV